LKINYLKINNFGKLKNKEIKLNNNINLIYGKNESGKTTLLKFIIGMLYGISKNKNGEEISDFDKYRPWNNEEFSGKIIYKLDNNEIFEVFRDFSKKNPQIYNSKLEDITKEFNINKNKQIQFFYDQLKIEENLFLNTTVVEQDKTILDLNSQKNLTQKIANILSAGDDNFSYKKITDKLNKKIIEEIGTDRTQGRPINNIENEIKIYENKINLLEENKLKKNKIIEEIKNKNEEINLLNEEIKILKEIKFKKENEKINIEKIKINKNIKKDYEEKIKKIENNKINNKENKTNKKTIKNKLIIISFIILINIMINIIKINSIIKFILLGASFISILLIIINLFIEKNKLTKNNNKINLEKIKIENELNILEENLNNKNKEILNEEKFIEENKIKNIQEIISKYNNILNNEDIIQLFNKSYEEVNSEINLLENKFNKNKIEINTLYIEEKNINQMLDEYVESCEKIQCLYSERKELEKLNNDFNILKKCLENAYYKMKNNVTPKLTNNLSSIVENVSNGKYKKVKFDSDKGLIVELDNGEYINANRLSLGTIDQLYLSLRLSSMQSIINENMPIILDETFAYFDNERLENIIKYINENYKNNQIIIFSCNNREKEICEKLGIEYNYVEL